MSDVGTGALVARAGLIGAAYNVRINLKSIDDETFGQEMRESLAGLVEEGGAGQGGGGRHGECCLRRDAAAQLPASPSPHRGSLPGREKWRGAPVWRNTTSSLPK